MPRYSGSSWRSYRPSAADAAASGAEAPRRGVSADCRILGLDPGSLRTGFGLIDCSAAGERHVVDGCIRAGSGSFSGRLRCIYEAIAALIEEHRPDEIAIERVFMHRNPDSALKLGQARGAAICAAVTRGAAVHEYAARAIKLAVSGYGAADKAQVAQMVTALLGLARRPVADAADALAVALCHAQTRRVAALVRSPLAVPVAARAAAPVAPRAGTPAPAARAARAVRAVRAGSRAGSRP
jgi:crossover junction endodeoxyribonuclease RuvC